MADAVVPSEALHRRIMGAVRDSEQRRRGRFGQVPWGRRPPPDDRLQGFLASDLAAPASPLGPPTTVMLDVYSRDASTGELSYSGVQVELANYDLDTEGDAGTHAHAHVVNGVWQCCWLGCTAAVNLVRVDGDELQIDGEYLEMT